MYVGVGVGVCVCVKIQEIFCVWMQSFSPLNMLNPSSSEYFLQTYFAKGDVANPIRVIDMKGHPETSV